MRVGVGRCLLKKIVSRSTRSLGMAEDPAMLHFPPTERNKEPILETLKHYLKPADSKMVLEVGSGSGEHITFFAPEFPLSRFQPCDVDQTAIESVRAYIKARKNTNVWPPLQVDVAKDVADLELPEDFTLTKNSLDVVINTNMIHISSNAAVAGLFRNAGRWLKCGGVLFTYGPYAQHGVISPQSNVNFHKSLVGQNKEWGLRDVDFLETLAKENHMELECQHDLPAHNKVLIFRKI